MWKSRGDAKVDRARLDVNASDLDPPAHLLISHEISWQIG